MTMRLGVLILPEFGWQTAQSVWRRAEELGVEHAWTYDHLAWRSFRDSAWFASIPTLTAAAIATERLRVGTLVASPNFRHPVPFAKELVTLDDISGGRTDWKKVLREFWQQFSAAIDGTRELTITQVIATLDEDLGRHFFPDDGSGKDVRLCPSCAVGRLGLRLGKFGAFIACSNYPNCRYT